MEENLKNLKPSFQVIRSIVYSSALTFVLLILINAQTLIEQNLYGAIGFFGVILASLEAFFTTKYLNIHVKEKNVHKSYDLTHHLVNHLFYPVITYFALCLFLLVENNLFLAYSLIILNFILTALYLYFLPYHILFDHKDHSQSKYSSLKIDFISYIFKFFSFFVSCLALFTFYSQSRVTTNYVVISLFILCFIYLFFHMFRKMTYSNLNMFLCFLFTVIFTFFTSTLITNNSSVNALISTLFFYLVAAIFYHKVDGTFTYKVLVEYSAVGLIVSIIIFSIK